MSGYIKTNQSLSTMGRPPQYKTEEDRVSALRASWRSYGAQHREERRLQNKLYNKKPEVIERRREGYHAKKNPVEQGEPMLAFVRPRVQILQRVEDPSPKP